MRKLLCRTGAAILALSIVGCDSLPFLGGAGEEEATSESSPSPTAQTPGTPSPSPTAFASPDVPQKPSRVSALTQSSNADERVSQLERAIGRSGQTQTTTPSTTPELPPGRDPFAVDIPIPPPSGDLPGPVEDIDEPLVVTELPRQQVPQLPSLPELARPPQIGGTKLVGAEAPPIRLSPLADRVVNEFRTFQALLDDTTTYSDYTIDLDLLIRSVRGEEEDRRNSTRRQLLLTNRSLYRRLEKILQEYIFASRLWDTYYNESDDPDTVRCSSIPAIERAINVYQAQTIRRGQLLCATRIALLGSVWQRADNILNAALRDTDFNAPSLADVPSLPDAGEPMQLGQLPQVPEFERPSMGTTTPTLPDAGGPMQLGQLPQVPEFERPSIGTTTPSLPDAGAPTRLGQLPQVPEFERSAPPTPTLPDVGPPTRLGQLPQLPEALPTLAEQVEVTGVMEVRNEKRVILKAPNEASSRSVRVGERVAGGKVLVKRVEFENGEAIVILEEENIETRKIVGEEPAVVE